MNILFVCTGNTCRSPMAEGILREIAKEKGLEVNISSAGIAALDGSDAAENAVIAMEKIGIDIKNHKSTILHRELIMNSDLILTMSKNHKDIILSNFPKSKDKVFTLTEYATEEDGDILDPFGGSLEIYEKTRDEIYKLIEKIIDSKED